MRQGERGLRRSEPGGVSPRIASGLILVTGLWHSNIDLETTIVSYLTARASCDLVVAAHQQLTVEWWESHRHRYDLLVSDLG
jgi:hypothetical protein